MNPRKQIKGAAFSKSLTETRQVRESRVTPSKEKETYEAFYFNLLFTHRRGAIRRHCAGRVRSGEACRKRLCGLGRRENSLCESGSRSVDRYDPRLSGFLVHVARPDGGVIE